MEQKDKEQSPTRQQVREAAVKRGLHFVSRSYGECSTDTVSLDALCDIVRDALAHSAAPGGDVASPLTVVAPLENGVLAGGSALGLVERLRNGGQPDLADMAEGLLEALQKAADMLGSAAHFVSKNNGLNGLLEAQEQALAAIDAAGGAQ